MDVAEIISHHILDHDWGVSLGGFRIPLTTHSVTILAVSVLLFCALCWIARVRQSRSGRLLTALAEEYVLFIRDGMVLPNMGKEGKGFLPYLHAVSVYFVCKLGGYDSRNEDRHF